MNNVRPLNRSLSTGPLIQAKLEGIEEDLARLQNEVEDAAAKFFSAKRDYELDYSKKFIAVEGKNKDEREAKAKEALEGTDSYRRLKETEGTWEGKKLAVKVLESRAAIGMSLLRHQTRVSSA